MANHISFHPIYIIRSGYTDAASVCMQTINRDPVRSQLQHPPRWGPQGWPGAFPCTMRHGAAGRITEQFGSQGAVKGLSLLCLPLCSGLSVHLAKFGIALSGTRDSDPCIWWGKKFQGLFVGRDHFADLWEICNSCL